MERVYCVLVLSLRLVLSQYAQSPCPGVFDYGGDSPYVYGVVKLKSNSPVSTLTIRTIFTVEAQLFSNYVGRIVAEDSERLLRKYNSGVPVTVRVHFPVTSPPPRLTALTVNGNTICSGPAEFPRPGRHITTLSLQHTAYLHGGGDADKLLSSVDINQAWTNNNTEYHINNTQTIYDQSTRPYYGRPPQQKYDRPPQRNDDRPPQQNYDRPPQQNYRPLQQNYDWTSQQNYDRSSQQNYDWTSQQNYDRSSQQNYDWPSQQNYDRPPQQNYNQPPQQNYDRPSQQNYDRPPQQNYNQPSQQNDNWPPQQNYDRPPQQNYDRPPQQNYDRPSKQNFDRPPQQNYNQPPQQNYNRLPQQNHERPPQQNYDRPPQQNYDQPPQRNYDRPSQHNYDRPPQQNYDRPPQQNYDRPPQQNYNRSPQQNYDRPPQQNYNRPPQQNYDRPPQQNYDWPPQRNYDRPSQQNYDQPPQQNYDRPPQQNYDRPPQQNYNRPPQQYNDWPQQPNYDRPPQQNYNRPPQQYNDWPRQPNYDRPPQQNYDRPPQQNYERAPSKPFNERPPTARPEPVSTTRQPVTTTKQPVTTTRQPVTTSRPRDTTDNPKEITFQKPTPAPTQRPVSPPSQNVECGVVANLPLNNTATESYTRGDVPWLVAIYKDKSGVLKFACGGTLVSDRHVVTAAHCMQQESELTSIKEFFIKVGVLDLNEWSDDLTVTRSIVAAHIHEGYDAITLENDLLVLTLDRRVEFNNYIRPACLWAGNTDLNAVVGGSGVVLGWGDLGDPDLMDPGIPQMVIMPIVSNATCRYKQSTNLTSSKTLWCVVVWCGAVLQTGSGTCMHNSGGGLYIMQGGKWKLRGVLSFRPFILTDYTVFTDTAHYHDWIEKIISG